MNFFSGRKVRIWRSDSVAIFRSAKTITLQGSDVISRAENGIFRYLRQKIDGMWHKTQEQGSTVEFLFQIHNSFDK